jgi:hypothetical protein
MSITDSADYQRGMAVCDEHHPLRVNASGVGIRTMTKADLIVLVGKQARRIEALETAAKAVNKCFWDDDVVVDETNYTSAFMEAAMDLHAALAATQEGTANHADTD